MNKTIIWTILISAGLLSIGTAYAITAIDDEATVTTPNSSTSPTVKLAQTGSVAWNNFLESPTGDYIIGIDGGSNAIEITRAGIGISETRIFSDVFIDKNAPKMSVIAVDTSTSPILQFAQAGNIGWNYRLEPGSGDLIVGVDGGQDAIEITRFGINVAFTTFPNGNVGIGTSPSEKLDVDGNIRLTGNIVSPNDICIGNCP